MAEANIRAHISYLLILFAGSLIFFLTFNIQFIYLSVVIMVFLLAICCAFKRIQLGVSLKIVMCFGINITAYIVARFISYDGTAGDWISFIGINKSIIECKCASNTKMRPGLEHIISIKNSTNCECWTELDVMPLGEELYAKINYCYTHHGMPIHEASRLLWQKKQIDESSTDETAAMCDTVI